MYKRVLIINIVLLVSLFTAVGHSEEEVYKDYTDIGPIEGPVLSIEDLFSDRDKNHREIITVQGKIADLEYKKLFTGRKFTLFIVEDGKGNKINVYARGTVEGLKDGSEIRVHGRYSKSKRFGFKKYKNVMKARTIQLEGL